MYTYMSVYSLETQLHFFSHLTLLYLYFPLSVFPNLLSFIVKPDILFFILPSVIQSLSVTWSVHSKISFISVTVCVLTYLSPHAS